MRLRANLSRLLVPLVITTVGGGAGRALAQDYEPAHVKLLTDRAAQWFLNLDPPPPEDGRVLVAGGDEGTVFAFVLGSKTEDANDELEALKVAEVEGCEPEGVTCCDEQAHVWVIDSEFDNERFWLRLGQYCEAEPVQDGSSDDEPSNAEPGAPVISVDPQIWQDLTELGVTQPLMTMATANHEMGVLVAPSWQKGDLFLPRHLGLRSLSPIILVNHVNPNTQPPGPPAPPGGCATGNYCKSQPNRRCYADRHQTGTAHAARHHWYVKMPDRRWCEQVDKCNC